MSIGSDLLVEVLDAIERDPELAARVRRLLGVAPPVAEPTPIYERVASFARRVSLSERSIWTLASEGMPMVGSGRGRRVDVARAIAWIRERNDAVDDAVEREARASAARAAGRAAR